MMRTSTRLEGESAPTGCNSPVSQQQRLHAQPHVADLVEKDRAAVRLFERADLVPIGAGEAPLHVPEELGLEQRLGDAGAIERHEALGGASGAAVNQAREHVLADAAFAGNEHLHVARGHAGRDADRVFHRGTRPDDHRVEGIVVADSVRSGHCGVIRFDTEQSTGQGRRLPTTLRVAARGCMFLSDASHVAAGLCTDLSCRTWTASRRGSLTGKGRLSDYDVGDSKWNAKILTLLIFAESSSLPLAGSAAT
jgi:hypothetical protein